MICVVIRPTTDDDGQNLQRALSELAQQDPTISLISSLAQPDGMRRPVSGGDAVGSQVIDVLKAQEIKETGNEED
jgi:hypothetical protein